MDVEAAGGSVILANIINSYFDRTFEHFCSHRQTPSSGKAGSPAVVQNGRVIYFSHPIFTQYQKNAPRWCKVIFLNAVKILLPEPIVKLEAPTSTLTAVNEQSAENRWVLHLLHYIPERRGQDFDIIEDVIPIFNVKVSVKPPKRVKRVVQVPQNELLKSKQRDGRVEFILPELEGHQMIALDF